jgi:hypothetical protein
MKILTAFALSLLSAVLFSACTRDAQALSAEQIEQQYGVAGGGAGGGAAIGALAGGKKGAGIGAAAGGVGGLIYDLMIRDKK